CSSDPPRPARRSPGRPRSPPSPTRPSGDDGPTRGGAAPNRGHPGRGSSAERRPAPADPTARGGCAASCRAGAAAPPVTGGDGYAVAAFSGPVSPGPTPRCRQVSSNPSGAGFGERTSSPHTTTGNRPASPAAASTPVVTGRVALVYSPSRQPA